VYSDVGKYNGRKNIVVFDFDMDVSNVYFKYFNNDQASTERNFEALKTHVENAIELTEAYMNLVSVRWMQNAWDNVVVPLGPTEVVSGANDKFEDVFEQRTQEGITGKDGVTYYEARFPTNGTRYTYTVPTFDELTTMIDTSTLEGRVGYTTTFFPEANRPYIVITEDLVPINLFADSSPEGVTTIANITTNPANLINNAVSLTTYSVEQTPTGISIREPEWASSNFNFNDPAIAQIPEENVLPTFMGPGQFTRLVDHHLGQVYAQIGSIIEDSAPNVFVGTIQVDNTVLEGKTGDNVNIVADDDLKVYAVDESIRDFDDGDRAIGINDGGKITAIPFTPEVPIADVTTQELFCDRVSKKLQPGEAYTQLGCDGSLRTNLLDVLTKLINTVNCMQIEPVVFTPTWPNTIWSTTMPNNTSANTVEVFETSGGAGDANRYVMSTNKNQPQDVSLVMEYQLPLSFDSANGGFGTTPFQLTTSASGSATVEAQIFDTTGAADTNEDITSASFTPQTFGTGMTGTYTPGGCIRVAVTGTLSAGESIEIGKLQMNFGASEAVPETDDLTTLPVPATGPVVTFVIDEHASTAGSYIDLNEIPGVFEITLANI